MICQVTCLKSMMHGNVNKGAVPVSETWGKRKLGGNGGKRFLDVSANPETFLVSFHKVSKCFFCFAWAFQVKKG